MEGRVEPDPLAVRRRFAGHLVGVGVEIGPGHVPFPVPPTVQVRFVDRWEPTENSSLFPELGDDPGFPRPDLVANLDVDRLGALADGSQDFVIASHIIEHLANPLAMIVDIHRVLRPRGLFVLLLPDRHKTFDQFRSATPLTHLVDEYRRDVREVDDEHILDFIIASIRASGDNRDFKVLLSERTPGEIDLHRRRSVHAHVWDMGEFQTLLEYSKSELGAGWEVVDVAEPGGEGTHGNEFGWLLARSDSSVRAGNPRKRRFRFPTDLNLGRSSRSDQVADVYRQQRRRISRLKSVDLGSVALSGYDSPPTFR
jgi:SAM-dependent methyltransferase